MFRSANRVDCKIVAAQVVASFASVVNHEYIALECVRGMTGLILIIA